ncbi:TonB-dependent receptor [Brevundimonas mediterranea]|uniref:TonB-dependent receptor n=1 Tax=Brevundimonas mediterranea TaxID=74329 RepID=A0A7W6A5Y4_9CAUL|nr:TonB-dependent receptor [Brevundimonas mediterranea]MBB3872777.1 TonB-dependent receptor [Brevundimonas mediterranea]
MKFHLLASASLASLAAVTAALPAHAYEASALAASVAVAGEVVHGRVTNAAGDALPGAEVIVRATGQRAVTNTQGEFDLVLPTGTAVLDVRYIGQPSATQTVSVVQGGTEVSIMLGAGEAATVSDVIVTGVITDGVARSLNQQKNADGTVNVLSADAIGRYPDPNVAESLQRVQGIAIQRDQGEGRYINVRGAPSAFTAVSVDGVQVPAVDPGTRAVDLDTLPSDIVANIEVSKTLLPSQEADSIAGAVNIKTRSPFDRRRLAVSGYAGGSYNDYGGSDTRAGATASNVFADQTFGALLSVSYSETNRRPDNVENAWVKEEQNGADVFVLEETLFKDYETKRTRQAVTGALEWRPTDDFRAYLRGSFAQFEDDEYRNTLGLIYSDGTLQPGATNTSATYTGARITRQLRHRTQKNDITTLVAGGEKTFDNGAVWDASLSWADSEQTYPNRNELLYRSSATTLSYNTTDHYMPTYSVFSDATGFYRDPTKFSFRENTFRENSTKQEDVAFRTNFELPSQFAGRDVTWKFGAKFNSREINADEQRYRNRASSASPGTLASVLSDRASRNYDYDLGFKFDADLADAYFASARAASPIRLPDSIAADYTAQEDILAGYAQARFDMGATNVIIGLRVENTKFDGEAAALIDNDGSDPYDMAKVSRDDTEFFPNLTLRHSFSDNLIGRFALTRSISRPEFSQIVPRRIEETDGSNISYEIGNPDLQPTLSNNIDVGLEYYFTSLGVVSANAFYKDLTDYRYILKYTEAFGADGEADFETPINAPDGHLAGLELNLQRKFDFLPGLLSGFGVFANYTWTDAEIKTAQSYGGRDTFSLPGQSDSNYNAALFYEMAGFSARLSYTKRGDYLEEINADDADLDLYVEGREQLDFTTSYDFGNGVELFGEAKNLTDSAGVRYYGSRERTYEYEKFGYNIFVGVRFKL